jgi:hypothetical protein
MIQGITIEVKNTRVAEDRIAVEDSFKSPPLAGLSTDDQAFAMEFVHCHGINAMRYSILR